MQRCWDGLIFHVIRKVKLSDKESNCSEKSNTRVFVQQQMILLSEINPWYRGLPFILDYSNSIRHRLGLSSGMVPMRAPGPGPSFQLPLYNQFPGDSFFRHNFHSSHLLIHSCLSFQFPTYVLFSGQKTDAVNGVNTPALIPGPTTKALSGLEKGVSHRRATVSSQIMKIRPLFSKLVATVR